ncbi:MAG: cohesin domain-containing protein [Balneolaceae bacterium]
MKRTLFIFQTLSLLLILSMASYGQIQLSIPDTSGTVGDTLKIPIRIDSTFTSKGVLSLQLELSYSDYYASVISVETNNTILGDAGWSVTPNLTQSGKITIAAAGTTELTGTGNLVFLNVVLLRPGGTGLTFQADESYLNEGSPNLIFKNGYISISAKPVISVYLPSGNYIIGDSLQANVSGGVAPFEWSVTDTSHASINVEGLLRVKNHGRVGVIGKDSRGIIDTAFVDFLAFRLNSENITNYNGQEVSFPIQTTNLTGLGIQSGSFTLNTPISSNFEVIGIEKGDVLDENASLNYKVNSNGINIGFAQTEELSGYGNLFILHIRYLSTFYKNVTFTDVLFNEDIKGVGTSFLIQSNTLPALNISNGSPVTNLVGESLQFSVTNNIGPVTWAVSNTNTATIDGQGLLKTLKGGKFKVSVTDSVGATGSTSDFTYYDLKTELPDTSMLIADTLYYPVRISNMESSSIEILSADITFTYTNTDLNYLGFSAVNALTEGWSYSENILAPNKVKIAAAGSEAVTQNGDMVYLIFKVDTSVSADKRIYPVLSEFLYNEGSPNTLTKNGNIFISTKPIKPVLIFPNSGMQNTGVALTLTWDTSIGAESYDVQVSKSGSFTNNIVDTSLVLEKELSIAELEYRTYYYWRVRGVNSFGESDWSTVFTFKTQDPVPNSPTLNSPTNLVENLALDPTLKWSSVSYATAYRVEFDTTINFTTSLVDSTITSTNFIPPNLENGVSYYWRVFASNSTGESNPSETWMFTTIVEKPEAPNLLLPDNGEEKVDTLAQFFWNTSARAASYMLQVSSTIDFSSIHAEQTLTDTTVSVGKLSFLTEYYWRVKASNAGGESVWSSIFTFTVKAQDASIPELLSPSHNATGVDTSLTLRWRQAEGALKFGYQVSETSDFTIIKKQSEVVTDTSTVLSDLDYSTTYFWRVRGIGAVDTSNWSPIFTFTTKSELGELAIPKLLLPANDSLNAPTSLTFVWTSVVGATDYIIEVEADTLNLEIGISVSKKDTTVNLTVLLEETEHFWRVMAVDSLNSRVSDWSDYYKFTTKKGNTPPIFVNLPDTLSFRENEEFSFNYHNIISDHEDEIQHLKVEFEYDSTQISIAIDKLNGIITLKSVEYTGNTTLTIRVEDTAGAKVEASIVLFIESSVSSEFEVEIPSNYALNQNYPNPFNPNTNISFDLPESGFVRLEVFNMLGQKVQTIISQNMVAGSHKIVFDASRLSSGFYLYRLQSKSFLNTKKMVLIK